MKKFFVVLYAMATSFCGISAFAVAPATVADLTAGISLADVGLGVLAVAALLIGVYITRKAAQMIVGALRDDVDYSGNRSNQDRYFDLYDDYTEDDLIRDNAAAGLDKYGNPLCR